MPGVDPDLALRLAKTVADIYGAAAQQLLELVARRLARGIDQPGWAERKLLEQLGLRDEALAIVERLVVLGADAVTAAVGEGYAAGVAAAGADLGLVTRFGVTGTAAVDALAAETVGAIRATHSQILRSTLDVYRSTIAETSSQVVTGTQTRRQATQAALDRFANRGVTGFRDVAGRNWELESYAEMATRTAAGRAQIAGAAARFVSEGHDLVIVSDAPQECRLCRPFEGKVLSLSGNDPGYPSVRDAQAAGLFHANCRHALGAYIPGLTRRMTHTADPDGDASRQEQRRLERGIRQWKRRESVAITPDAERVAKAKVREWQARLRDHVAANDLKRLRYREQIGSAR